MLKIGIIGCGMIADLGHAAWYSRHPEVEIVAAADPSLKNLQKFAAKYHVPKIYTDPIKLIEKSGVDAVSICSPHWAHAEQAIRCAEHNINVLIEKPMGRNLEECDQIIHAVEKTKIYAQVGLQKRFVGAFQYIKEALEREQLGSVFQCSVYWYHSIPDLEERWIKMGLRILKKFRIDLTSQFGAWRLTDKRSGGGDWIDHGPHYGDLFRYWFGDIEHVSAEMLTVYQSRADEDHGIAIFKMKNGILAYLERSQNVVGRPYGLETGHIHGTKGSFYFDAPHEYTLKPAKLSKYTRLNIIPNKASLIHIPKTKNQVSYKRQIDAFVGSLIDKKLALEAIEFPPQWVPTIYDGRAAVEIVMAAYKSSQEQQTIFLPLK